MKQFMNDDDFLLESEPARELYHDHAKSMPVFDFHCHLPPEDIAKNRMFSNITDIWLRGDHYKWRAERTNGVPEERITGSATDRDKFQAWAETVPFTIGNPLYHWTHLELRRYFEINDRLDGSTAEAVWNRANQFLSQEEFRTRAILTRMNVRVVCTTDDPVDQLAHHEKIAADGFPVKVLPAFRPDKAMAVEDPVAFNAYMERLEQASGVTVNSWNSYRDALVKRIDYFHARGGRLS
ncbi:glucuronate isomerase, partial [Salinispira pacifica]